MLTSELLKAQAARCCTIFNPANTITGVHESAPVMTNGYGTSLCVDALSHVYATVYHEEKANDRFKKIQPSERPTPDQTKKYREAALVAVTTTGTIHLNSENSTHSECECEGEGGGRELLTSESFTHPSLLRTTQTTQSTPSSLPRRRAPRASTRAPSTSTRLGRRSYPRSGRTEKLRRLPLPKPRSPRLERGRDEATRWEGKCLRGP